MVEVHKDMLGRLGPNARVVFLDTPAGFQLNADQISAKASSIFATKSAVHGGGLFQVNGFLRRN